MIVKFDGYRYYIGNRSYANAQLATDVIHFLPKGRYLVSTTPKNGYIHLERSNKHHIGDARYLNPLTGDRLRFCQGALNKEFGFIPSNLYYKPYKSLREKIFSFLNKLTLK